VCAFLLAVFLINNDIKCRAEQKWLEPCFWWEILEVGDHLEKPGVEENMY
jgi:hypothetical protein